MFQGNLSQFPKKNYFKGPLLFLVRRYDYSVDSITSRMDLVTFKTAERVVKKNKAKEREFGKSHQIYAAYNRVNTVVKFIFKL